MRLPTVLKALLCASIILPIFPQNPSQRSQVDAAFAKLPLQFEANAGQTSTAVKFLARGVNLSLFLTDDGASLSLRHSPGAVVRLSLAGVSSHAQPEGVDRLPGNVNYLSGADSAKWHKNIATYAKVRYPGVYPGIDLLYYGNRSRLEFDFVVAPHASVARIRMRIDGAKPTLSPDGDLVLQAGSEIGRFQKPSIYQLADNRRETITGKFVLADENEVRFDVGSYDPTRPLIIDPVLLYASYLGGLQDNAVNGIAVNSRGETYVTGYTLAANFPTTPDSYQPGVSICHPADCSSNPAPGADAFVAKFNADGTSLLYSTYIGGNNDDQGRAITVDPDDNAYVTGYTFSNDFPITKDALQSLCGPQGIFNFSTATFVGLQASCEQHPAGEANVYSQNAPDVFITKLDPSGTQILYSTFYGGTANDNPNGIALDAERNIYIAGSTSSLTKTPYPAGGDTPYPVTASAYKNGLSDGGGFVAFVTKIRADGHAVLYSTVIGSLGQGVHNYTSAMALGSNGMIYFGGATNSPLYPVTPGAVKPACVVSPNGPCYESGFLSGIDTNQSGAASLILSTYLNGSVPAQSTSTLTGLAADADNNVYASGVTQARDFPTTAATVQPACAAAGDSFCKDAFVTKLSAAGALAWSTYYGSASNCCQMNFPLLAVDAYRNVYVAGQNGQAQIGDYDVLQRNAFQPVEGGGQDIFLATLTPDGSQVLFGSYYGGSCNETPTSLAVDANQNVYFGGYSCSTDLPVSAGAPQTVDPGYQQGFVGKISPVFAPGLTTLVVNAITTPAGAQVTLTATVMSQRDQAPATGSVDFYNGTTLLGTTALTLDGTASLTQSLPAGDYQFTANYNGSISSAQALHVTGAALPVATLGNVNAASLAPSNSIAANSIVTAFGGGLAAGPLTASTVPPPTSLEGVRVNVRDAAGDTREAPLFYVSPRQVNYVLPDATALGQATITITGNQTTFSAQQQIVAVAPGVFGANGLAVGNLILISGGTQSTTSLVGLDASGTLTPAALQVSSDTQQAVMILYGTGIRNHTAPVTATLGNMTLPVDYAGPQGVFVGEDQINIPLPASLKGSGIVSVTLNVDGQTTNSLKVNLQ